MGDLAKRAFGFYLFCWLLVATPYLYIVTDNPDPLLWAEAIGLAFLPFFLGLGFLVACRAKPDKGWKGAMITAVFVMLFTGYAQYSRSARQPENNVIWTNEDCAFEVSFPGEPELVTKEVPSFGETTSAQFVSANSTFQAECVAFTPEMLAAFEGPNREKVKKFLTLNFEESGIYPFEIEIQERENFIIGFAQGNKLIGGQPATYRKSFSVDGRSVFSATIAAPSAEFPAEGHMEFLGSIKLKSRD